MARPVDWLRDALAAGDDELANRLVSGLAPVGLYYPQPVLQTLLDAGVHVTDERVRPSVVHTLATLVPCISTSWTTFSNAARPDTSSRRSAPGRTSSWSGLLRVDRILQQRCAPGDPLPHDALRAAQTSLTELINANGPAQVHPWMTPISLALLRDADYQLINWTRL